MSGPRLSHAGRFLTAVAAAVLVALLGAVAITVIVCVKQPVPARRQLLIAMAGALVLRVALTLLLHALGSWEITSRGAVTPDEAVIDFAARLRAGGDDRSLVLLGGSLHTAWVLVAASLYEVWNSLLALKLVNAVLGTLLVVPAFLLARDLHSDRAGLYAAWAVALFPSAVVWSALALREPLIALVITTLLLAVVRLVGRVAPTRVASRLAALAVLGLLLLGFTRSYMVPLMLVLLAVTGLVATARQRSFVPLARMTVIGLLAIAAIAAVPNGRELIRTTVALADEQAPNIYNPFSDCADESACLPVGAGQPPADLGLSPSPGEGEPALSDSLQSVEQKGPARALLIATLAGRPVWRREEFFFLLQPGVVVWWGVLPLVAVGAISLQRRRQFAELTLLAGLSISVVLFLAYSGQFVRHHYMFEPVALVLAAVGAASLVESEKAGPRVIVAAASATMGSAAIASVLLSLF